MDTVYIHLTCYLYQFHIYLSFPPPLTFTYLMYAVNLGLNKEKPKEATLQVYKEFFEDEFLKATDVYYNAESTEFISLNSVADFMKKVLPPLHSFPLVE